jgi:hypothetical protein
VNDDQRKIHDLTVERDNLLGLNRTLEADRAALIAELGRMTVELDEIQQVARKSFKDLQWEYMTLEKKYHALVKETPDAAA